MNIKHIYYNNKLSPNITIKRIPLMSLIETDIPLLSSMEIKNCLQSMQFTLSKGDTVGSFSLTFYPEISNGTAIFDLIEIMDIVHISLPYTKAIGGSKVFVGIIKNKKIVGQSSESGGTRRVCISGISAAGLLGQYYINLDVVAMAIKGQTANSQALQKQLTIDMMNENPLLVSSCVARIWKAFEGVAETVGTPKIGSMIKAILGQAPSEFCTFDNSAFYYPLANVFRGEQTQDFFSLVDGVIPEPVYEKFAYCDPTTQKMKIMIRECPFDATKWQVLKKHIITPEQIKSFDFQQNDREVYTVFYAYLNGYPIDEQKSLILSTMTTQEDITQIVSDEKYMLYGYRPLIAHFIGYGIKDGTQDQTTPTRLKELTRKLKSWFENLPLMLNGSISVAMTTDADTAIQPGELVEVMGLTFYVEGVTYSWNCGSGGDINISLSRGGLYDVTGNFHEAKNVATIAAILEGCNL